MTRLAQLVAGLGLFAAGLWLGLEAELGVGPWDVLHGGLSELLGQPFGRTSIVVGLALLAVTTACGLRPGLGTLLNVVLVGAVLDRLLALPLLSGAGDGPLVVRVLLMLTGIAVVAAGSALYLGAHLGAGPRDGLMVVIAVRTGWSIGRSRAALEGGVLVAGVALGGPVGVGTLAFALGIGPAVQVAFRLLRQTPSARPA